MVLDALADVEVTPVDVLGLRVVLDDVRSDCMYDLYGLQFSYLGSAVVRSV